MTFHPTKERQQAFVDQHLNGGGVPDSSRAYQAELMARTGDFFSSDHACHRAMLWLDEADVKTLAEAWDRAPRADWLAWMYQWMKPTKADMKRWWRLLVRVKGGKKDVDRWTRDDYEDALGSGAPEVYPGIIAEIGDDIFQASKLCPGDGADAVREAIPNPWLKGVRR